jgi:hypothetical protein
VHADLRDTARVRTVVDFIAERAAAERELFLRHSD